MKIRTTILAFFLSLFCLAGQAQNNIFDKIEKRNDVQTVHVSQSLLRMIAEMDTGSADVSLSQLSDKLKRIDIYSSESGDACKYIKSEISNLTNDSSYENLMTVKEKNQTVSFFGKKDGENFKDLIMAVYGDNSCNISRFIGEFTAQDIQKVIKK